MINMKNIYLVASICFAVIGAFSLVGLIANWSNLDSINRIISIFQVILNIVFFFMLFKSYKDLANSNFKDSSSNEIINLFKEGENGNK